MGRRKRAAKLHGGGGRWRATQVSRFSRHHRQRPAGYRWSAVVPELHYTKV